MCSHVRGDYWVSLQSSDCHYVSLTSDYRHSDVIFKVTSHYNFTKYNIVTIELERIEFAPAGFVISFVKDRISSPVAARQQALKKYNLLVCPLLSDSGGYS